MRAEGTRDGAEAGATTSQGCQGPQHDWKLADAQAVFHDSPEGTSMAQPSSRTPGLHSCHLTAHSVWSPQVTSACPSQATGRTEPPETAPSPRWPSLKQMARPPLGEAVLRSHGLSIGTLPVRLPGGREGDPGWRAERRDHTPIWLLGPHSKGRDLTRAGEEKCSPLDIAVM